MNKNLSIEVIARAVIIFENKLVACRAKERDSYFLPGGHVEFGESAKEALAREIKEEMGVDAVVSKFIGVVENMYEQSGTKHHEINLVFLAQVADEKNIVSQEEHFEFSFIDIANLPNIKLLPDSIKKLIIERL